jgi:hypothetical protein
MPDHNDIRIQLLQMPAHMHGIRIVQIAEYRATDAKFLDRARRRQATATHPFVIRSQFSGLIGRDGRFIEPGDMAQHAPSLERFFERWNLE